MQKQHAKLVEAAPPDANHGADAAVTAAYIEALAAELEKLSAREGIESLASLLRLARIEARRVSVSQAA